jgi:hypothetical protein
LEHFISKWLKGVTALLLIFVTAHSGHLWASCGPKFDSKDQAAQIELQLINNHINLGKEAARALEVNELKNRIVNRAAALNLDNVNESSSLYLRTAKALFEAISAKFINLENEYFDDATHATFLLITSEFLSYHPSEISFLKENYKKYPKSFNGKSISEEDKNKDRIRIKNLTEDILSYPFLSGKSDQNLLTSISDSELYERVIENLKLHSKEAKQIVLNAKRLGVTIVAVESLPDFDKMNLAFSNNLFFVTLPDSPKNSFDGLVTNATPFQVLRHDFTHLNSIARKWSIQPESLILLKSFLNKLTALASIMNYSKDAVRLANSLAFAIWHEIIFIDSSSFTIEKFKKSLITSAQNDLLAFTTSKHKQLEMRLLKFISHMQVEPSLLTRLGFYSSGIGYSIKIFYFKQFFSGFISKEKPADYNLLENNFLEANALLLDVISN